MMQIVPGSTRWFWPNCNCNENGMGCAGHPSLPPGVLQPPEPQAPWWTTTTTFTATYPPQPRTTNKLVATTPFPKYVPTKVVKGGMALLERKIGLAELKVVLPTDDAKFMPGTSVFVRSDQDVHPWAKQIFTLDGVEFILVPESAIQVVKCAPWPAQVVVDAPK